MSDSLQIDGHALEAPSAPAAPGYRGDTFAKGVALLLAVTAVQRLIGLGRSVLVCRWLPTAEVGLWELAFSFLLVASSVMVLAIPGTLGRYVAYYQKRNQLRRFLRWSAIITAVLAVLGVAGLLAGRAYLSELIFNSPDRSGLLVLLAPCLLAAIAHNYSQSLLTALRLHRYFTLVQFAHAVFFAVLCVLFVIVYQGGAAGIIGAYGGACLLAHLGALVLLRPAISELADDTDRSAQNRFWSTIATFALWTWMGTTVASLFAVTDRYMIVHYSGMSGAALYGAIGQYHGALLIPRLLRQLAYAIGAMLVPHLTRAWESDRHDVVRTQLGLTIKLFAYCGTAGGAVAVLAAPLLFDHLLGGRYPESQQLLPTMLVSCIWFGMAILTQTRLWCAEKAWLGTVSFAIGLSVNVVLNWLLLPIWGLHGAVWATALANLTALILMQVFAARLGMQPLRGMPLWTALPGLLMFGPAAVLAGASLVAVLALRSPRLLTPAEKQKISETTARIRP